jgi:hypothetical protein
MLALGLRVKLILNRILRHPLPCVSSIHSPPSGKGLLMFSWGDPLPQWVLGLLRGGLVFQNWTSNWYREGPVTPDRLTRARMVA